MLSLLTVLLNIFILCRSDIDIKDAGIAPINEGDIAMILYLTLKNKCEQDLEISVQMDKCCEQYKESETNCNMIWMGGYMGMLYTKDIKNVTLIYPNMYFSHRQGTCTVAVKYRNDKYEKVMNKVIEFKTNITTEDQNSCPTYDTDPLQECRPQDCVIKYSGERSYFNPSTKECECAQICLNDPQKSIPEIAYSWTSNVCINLGDSVSKLDLENLESGQIDFNDAEVLQMTGAICHHGDVDSSGECQCQNDWKTTLNDDDVYEPSLLQYHMCNVEAGGWNCVNRSKIKTTVLIIAIFAVTIASKILLLMCLLNWCYKQFKVPKEIKICTDQLDPSDKSLLVSENIGKLDKCICDDLKKKRSPLLLGETVNVSYYPCAPSTISSVKVSIASEKAKQGYLSGTTTSSMPISFQSGTTGESTEDSDESDEDDYEIEFSEEQEDPEFCGDEECLKKGERHTGGEQTDFTESVEDGSKRAGSNRTRSKVSSEKSARSNKGK